MNKHVKSIFQKRDLKNTYAVTLNDETDLAENIFNTVREPLLLLDKELKEESLDETAHLTEQYLEILFNHADLPIIIWSSSPDIYRFSHRSEDANHYSLNRKLY